VIVVLVKDLDKHVGRTRTDEQRAYTRAATARWGEETSGKGKRMEQAAMKPSMLLYRHILCATLGGIDNYDERRMIAFLIARIDTLATRGII
jgi:hypothetical protein